MIYPITSTLNLLLRFIFEIILLAKNEKFVNFLMYSLIFVCIFTSADWGHISTTGELLRFDKVKALGKLNIYYVYAIVFFLIICARKFILKTDRAIRKDNNFLKIIFVMFFVHVNIIVYYSIYINDIVLEANEGLWPIAKSFVYVSVVFFTQDLFFNKKNFKQINNIITFIQVNIFLRCSYTIGKYLLGYGQAVAQTKGAERILRLGQENDFADFFLLLFIIASTKLLFAKNESVRMRLLHFSSIILSTFIIIGASRRYLWGEFVTAIGLILFFHYWFNRIRPNKKIILACLILLFVFSAIFVIGPDNLIEHPVIGRFMTIFSLISPEYESKHGFSAGHTDEIIEGWYNVKKHWLLGISPYGDDLMERFETKGWQSSVYVHNAYLQVWLVYGLLGLVLFIMLYYKAIELGAFVFFKLKNQTGIILMTFMLCQLVKNIVWPTVLMTMNLTIIYIFLIALVLKIKQLDNSKKAKIINPNKLNMIAV